MPVATRRHYSRGK